MITGVVYLPVLEGHLGVDGLGWDRVLVKNLVEFHGVVNVAHKDDDLVELQLVNEIHELGDLVALLKAHVVLAETVKRQLALLLDQDLGRVPHELAARDLDLLRECSSEHHHLFAMRRALENLLDIATHV